ncbi:KLHL42 [Branchiostoma lanceolatum]|uniref:KLHL42 protein n=1 Tax=Branchiostoma lanceolatum TaxID=7740 RepID=A0A8J9Z5Q1_BRALA|nr:KLHL42 [Branchiostoma lanceolatum]
MATILVDKKTFKVSKRTLMDKSDFFAAMFASGMKETTQNSAVLHDVSAGVFRDLLVFMETGKLRCEIDEELLTAAAFLQMQGVIEHSLRHVDVTNCIEFLSVAETHCLPKVKEAVLKFLTENFLDVISSRTFEHLSSELIDSVVKRRHARKRYLFGLGSYDDSSKERSDLPRNIHLFDDVTEQWQTGCDLPPLLCTHACGVAVLYNYIFVVGGYTSSECTQMQQVATCFDPLTNNWKELPCMNQCRAHFALIPHDDYIYALGGCVSFSSQSSSVKKLLSSVEAYSLRGRAWVGAASLPKETAQPCGASC